MGSPHRFLPRAVIVLALAACSPPPAASPADSPGQTDAPPTAAAAAYPRTLTDDAGREVTLEAEPRRIVSLAPSNTEIACALGACERLVGVPEYREGYPPEVLTAIEGLPVVVTFGPIEREQVVATEPDLVLAAGNELTPSADIEALAELGLEVLVLYPESLDEVYADIELVGQAIDRTRAATELVAEMRTRVGEVADAVAGRERPRVFYEVSVFEGVIYTAGEDSFLASLIDLAGGEPITGDPLSTAIPLEDLVVADPEVILLGDATYDPSITPQSVAERPGWGQMSAVRQGRVLPVAEDILITRPGPQIVDGLVALAGALHPEAFD